ncbi:hemerythrin domain-containing protein [Haloechinothrix salitolerans]|uniref:Hemerythrin domain-containing protein n=1 Tax=Haloechinothrix salitolerans TaxID=926830 RepID=A0ABW2C0M6_9PSEU
MTAAQQADLVSVIVNDHRAVEQAFSELESGAGDAEYRHNLTDHVIAELVRHSIAEEQFMYPAVRRYLDGGEQIADKEIEEHGEAEKIMKQLESADATDEKFDQLLRQLIQDVRHHVEDEENNLLPKLQHACTADELRDLGSKVEQAKKVAPTRPHPSAPNTPPANLVLAPGTAFIDKIRDTLSGRQT